MGTSTTVGSMISSSSESIIGTFGLSITSYVNFMGTFVKQILGAGLGVLQALMPWIIAVVVISAIIYFLYRAFRFFRH